MNGPRLACVRLCIDRRSCVEALLRTFGEGGREGGREKPTVADDARDRQAAWHSSTVS